MGNVPSVDRNWFRTLHRLPLPLAGGGGGAVGHAKGTARARQVQSQPAINLASVVSQRVTFPLRIQRLLAGDSSMNKAAQRLIPDPI